MAKKTRISSDPTPIKIGTAYLFRTVTHYHVGRVKAITPDAFILADAAWIADTGRFHEALKNSTLNEVEPFPTDCILFRSGLIDACKWPGRLPLEVK